jgi:dTDP-L-rhamnose 4-epimerase
VIRDRILVTGGAGFIGSALSSVLAEQAEVLVLDNLHEQVHSPGARPALPPNVSFVLGDVASQPVVRETIGAFRPTAIVHLAAETGTGQSLSESRRHAHVNVTGLATVLDVCSALAIDLRRIVLPSSRAVYGEGHWSDAGGGRIAAQPRLPRDLEAASWNPRTADGEVAAAPLPNEFDLVAPNPSSVYAATKLAQEHLVRIWCHSFGVPVSILRLQNVYGGGQSVGNPYTGVLTLMARQALTGAEIEVYEGGGIIRDFVHVTDVVAAIVSALTPDGPNNFFADIGSGQPVELRRVAELIADCAGAPQPVVTARFRPGDVRAAFASLDSARSLFGYAPQVALEEGLAELLAWVEPRVNM